MPGFILFRQSGLYQTMDQRLLPDDVSMTGHVTAGDLSTRSDQSERNCLARKEGLRCSRQRQQIALVRLISASCHISREHVTVQSLVHGQVTIIFVVSVCLSVCAEFFSAVFDPISIKLGHMLYVWV